MNTMKHRLLLSLITLFSFTWLQPLIAEEASTLQESEKDIFRIVVNTDEEVHGFRAWNDEEEMYQRIKRNFTKVFEKMEWPVTLKFHRWSANIPDEGLELRVWFKSLEEETLDDLVFRAWVNLWVDGEKVKDFGIIKVTTYPRPGRNTYDTLEENVALAGEDIAKKLNKQWFNKSD